MHNPLNTILIVFFLVCEILGALNIGSPRFNLTAAGLAFFAASLLF